MGPALPFGQVPCLASAASSAVTCIETEGQLPLTDDSDARNGSVEESPTASQEEGREPFGGRVEMSI